MGKDTKETDNIHRALTNIEKHAVDVYLSTHSLTETAKEIGRSLTWVAAKVKQPHIKHEIDMAQKDSAMRAGITNEWLIEEIKDTALKAKKDASWNAALKGFELLGKINGMFDAVDNNGVTYNVMGSVILAPDETSAKKLLAQPDKPIEGEFEVLEFNIGEEVKKK